MSNTIIHDRPEQLASIEAGLLDDEQIIAVFDCKGGGTGFVGVTTKRLILQDNSFVGKKTALTSVPYGRITSISFVSDKSMFGKFTSSSSLAISTSGNMYQAEFRGDEKAKYMHDTILAHILS
jgi:hypothetical protein